MDDQFTRELSEEEKEAFLHEPLSALFIRTLSAHQPWKLLAVLHHGFLWGVINNNQLQLSNRSFENEKGIGVTWEPSKLQQLFIFNKVRELFIWREHDGFEGCWLVDGPDPDSKIDENYILWGQCEDFRDPFCLMVERRQGFKHAPPVQAAVGSRISMVVRHFLTKDVDNQSIIAASRLVDLIVSKE